MRADSPTTLRPQALLRFRLTRDICWYNPPDMTRAIDESALRKQLAAEGFSHTFVWQDGPDAFYPDHTHGGLTAHIILDGEMTLNTGGKSQTYRLGERCDVPAGVVHSAQMGPKGCRYLVGEK